MNKQPTSHITPSTQKKLALCLFCILILLSCKDQKAAQKTPWGTVLGDSVSLKEHYSLHDIISNGELILLTLTGPETYYEYQRSRLGTQYLLCEKFAKELGVSLRVEVCRDTLEMVSRLQKGEGDIMILAASNIAAEKEITLADHRIPWTVSKQNIQLADTIRRWYHPKYLAEVKAEQNNALSTTNIQRKVYAPIQNKQKGIISNYDHLFKRYAPVARVDWRLLAALCYQESCFDPNARSWAGACGLMQIMPQTAAQYGLPQSQIFNPEANIETATRIIRNLKEQYRDIPHEGERLNFVLASYNGGTAHVRDAMALARKYGKNPHRWGDVAEYILLLSQPQYYQDAVVKSGYMRGTETYNYVRQVQQRHTQYRGTVAGGAYNFGNGQPPKQATKHHRFKL